MRYAASIQNAPELAPQGAGASRRQAPRPGVPPTRKRLRRVGLGINERGGFFRMDRRKPGRIGVLCSRAHPGRIGVSPVHWRQEPTDIVLFFCGVYRRGRLYAQEKARRLAYAQATTAGQARGPPETGVHPGVTLRQSALFGIAVQVYFSSRSETVVGDHRIHERKSV